MSSSRRASVLERAARTLLRALALAPLVFWSAPAAAYQSPMRFGEAPETGGGGGRFFTGSAVDNYTCKVCHTGGKSPFVQIKGLPLEGYVPGRVYPITVDWDDRLESVALNFEVVDGSGVSVGTVAVPEVAQLTTSDLCKPVEAGRPGVLLLPPMAAGRPLALVAECGSKQATVQWTAPLGVSAATAPDVWFVGSLVSSDSDGTAAGDGVTDFAHVFGERHRAKPPAVVVGAGCHASLGAPRPGAWAWGLLLLACGVLLLRRHRTVPVAAALAACVPLVGFASHARADSLSSAVYIRNDSDDTLVVSPRAHVTKHVEENTQLDVTYAADVWTSASIDIRTSASKPVTEQRDELDVGVAHELQDITLTGSYRLSLENDYASNGGSAGGTVDFADNNATAGLNVNLFRDSVGKSGDPSFSRGLMTFGSRLSFTQVLTADMISQLTYELSYLAGYQASPYRVVGIGGTGYGCMGAFECLPEHQPDRRTRHAMAVLVRGALSSELSLGGNYRFYMDDWGLNSHTFVAQLGWLPAAQTLLTLRYRFYTQTGAEFYQAVYERVPDPKSYTTRDREQSPMRDHRIGVDVQQKAQLDDRGLLLVLNAGIGGDFYTYDDFVGLDHTNALELVFGVAVEQ